MQDKRKLPVNPDSDYLPFFGLDQSFDTAPDIYHSHPEIQYIAGTTACSHPKEF